MQLQRMCALGFPGLLMAWCMRACTSKACACRVSPACVMAWCMHATAACLRAGTRCGHLRASSVPTLDCTRRTRGGVGPKRSPLPDPGAQGLAARLPASLLRLLGGSETPACMHSCTGTRRRSELSTTPERQRLKQACSLCCVSIGCDRPPASVWTPAWRWSGAERGATRPAISR